MGYQPIMIAKKAAVKNRCVYLDLADGSTHSFPVAYYPLLANASDAQIKKVQLRLGGKALRWEALDEDIWVADAVTGKYPCAEHAAL